MIIDLLGSITGDQHDCSTLRDWGGAVVRQFRFQGPLLRPGRCPLFVRNDRHAMPYSGTR